MQDDGPVRFGEFEFDAREGALRRLDDPAAEITRLAPQPARLLSLLVERRGALLTREEIRDAIWPGVAIDFDRGLHFCVGQVRAALGDTAADSRYVETLPRRGYRLIAKVEPAAVASDAASPSRSRGLWSLAAALMFAVALGALLVRTGPGADAAPTLRIGVMPFEAPRSAAAFENARPIAEWVLEELAVAGDGARVVGPTTTARYGASAKSHARLAADYDLDYLVNGRFIESEEGARMLAELIRVSDGAHVWVRSYDDLSQGRRIGSEIGENVVRVLELD